VVASAEPLTLTATTTRTRSRPALSGEAPPRREPQDPPEPTAGDSDQVSADRSADVIAAATDLALDMVRQAAVEAGRPAIDIGSWQLRQWSVGGDDLDLVVGRILLRGALEADRVAAEAAPVPATPGPAIADRVVITPSRLPLATSRRARTARAATWVRNLGAILLLFVAYQIWGTAFEQARAQAKLQARFAAAAPVGATNGAGPTTAAEEIPTVAAPSPDAPPPSSGAVVGRIQIEHIGMDQYVVEGTGTSELRKGPGHYTGSPLPGQPGNAAIAGHRTTYGAPFNRLDELVPGDRIVTTTAAGSVTYIVAKKPFAVSPGSLTVVNDYGDDRLTLTTCHPKLSARQRLVVVATPEHRRIAPAAAAGRGDAAAAAGGDTPAAAAPAADRPLRGAPVRVRDRIEWNLGVLPLAMVPALALIGLALGWRPLRRRWSVAVTALVMAPLWTTGLLVLFEHLNRMLPPNV